MEKDNVCFYRAWDRNCKKKQVEKVPWCHHYEEFQDYQLFHEYKVYGCY